MAEPPVTTPDERPKPLTGRAVRERRLRVDEVQAIDLMEMRRRGVLMGPSGASITWTRPAGLGIRAESTLVLIRVPGGTPAAFVFLHRGLSARGPVGAAFACVVLLTATRPHLGGWRWWFVCPLSLPHGEGEGVCGRRCRVLYLPPGDDRIGCRECLGLTYRSRQLHRGAVWERWDQPLRRYDRLAGDLRSRSPRRRFRALVAVDPVQAAAMLGIPVPHALAMRRVMRRGQRSG